MSENKSFFMIGAGNVAWHLGHALKNAGYTSQGVYSRHLSNAQELAASIGGEAFDDLRDSLPHPDFIVISVKDDAIADIVDSLAPWDWDSLIVHTAGSMPMDVFKNKVKKFGVLYPLQTFSKQRDVNFAEIPLFVEGCDKKTETEILDIAAKISNHPARVLNSNDRKQMHLAAVFASNFANHCYACAQKLLQNSGVEFEALLPLIDETARKVHFVSPIQGQTGPAVRNDRKIMDMHEKMLDGSMLDIYRVLSKGINKTAQNSEK